MVFPRLFAKVLRGLALVNLDIVPALGLECAFNNFSYIYKMVLVTMTPLALALLLAIGFAYSFKTKNEKAKNVISYLLLFLTYLVFVGTSTTLIFYFKCHTFTVPTGHDDQSYLYKDYSVSCNSNSYKMYRQFASLMICIYPIGSMLLALLCLIYCVSILSIHSNIIFFALYFASSVALLGFAHNAPKALGR